MIYILAGNDVKKRSAYMKTLLKDREVIRPVLEDNLKESLIGYAQSQNLFGDSPIILMENFLHDGTISLSTKDLNLLQESTSIFIFLEDVWKAVDEKKYKKYATIEQFDEKIVASAPKFNTFVITDAFGRHDKIGTWMLCREALDKGIEPEAISGLLFWKIKTMMLGSSSFTKEELKNQSSSIVSLYHCAHRGECDFGIGLEQFILSSLSK